MTNNNSAGSTASGQVEGLRILVVEDNADCAKSVAMLLQTKGHIVTVARTGSEAINAVKQESPEVVLLDIGLPDMSGYDVARQIKRHTPMLIAVTGFGLDEDRMRSAEAGIDLHLLKPINPLRLFAVLSEFQKSSRRTQAEGERPPTDCWN